MRDALVKLALAGIALVLALGALEVGLRLRAGLIDRGLLTPTFTPPALPAPDAPVALAHLILLSRNPRRIYQLRPDLDVRFQGGRVTTNARGWRRPSPSQAAAGALHIVGIGDSVMFGQGVDDDQTYLALLGERLAARHPGHRWPIVNLAVPGYNTVMEVAALRDDGLAFAPQVVVIEFVGNDLALPNFIREPAPVWSFDRSFLAAFVRGRLERRDVGSAPADQVLAEQRLVAAPPEPTRPGELVSSPEAAPAAYRDMVGWQAFEGAMRELATLAETHRFQVAWLLFIPGRQPLQDRAAALADRLGFLVVDAFGEVVAYLVAHRQPDYFGSPLAQAPDDGHPTPLGHRIAADALERALAENGVLDRAAR